MTWAPDYVTLAELKAYLRIDSGDTVDDAILPGKITAASRAVDNHCDRQFGQTTGTEARIYTATYAYDRATLTATGKWVVYIDDVQDVTGLTMSIAAGAITLYAKQPVNAAAVGKPYTRLVIDPASTILPTGVENEVTVTAKYGWTAVPATVKEATLLQAARLAKRRDAPFGVAGSPESGSEIRLLDRVDPDVAVMLKPYVRRIRRRLTVG